MKTAQTKQTRQTMRNTGSVVNPPREVSAVGLRNVLGDVLGRAEYGGERTIITRQGKPVAAIVPLSDLKRLTTAAA